MENDCYASLAGMLIQIQYGSVSRSRQLLRCMGTRLTLAGVLIQIQYGSVSGSRQLLRCMGTRLNLIESGGGRGGGEGTLQIFVLLCQNGWQ